MIQQRTNPIRHVSEAKSIRTFNSLRNYSGITVSQILRQNSLYII